MKRLILALAMGATFILSAVAPVTAQSEHAAAVVSHECVAPGVGVGTVTVRGDVVATFTAPAKQANDNAQGPCK